ncbi:MAG: GNAT family N-acetyltransferase [Desulfobacterales bacterium]|nr:GNAT family N-acetyltransferase [Desulfobacterales bacterium]
MQTPSIRRLKIEDAGIINQINMAITQDPAETDFREIVSEQVRGSNDASFVAEIDGRVVGYMIGSILLGAFGIKSGAWLSMMGVDPKFMGQGIGEKLADAFFANAKSKGLAHVHTSVRWDSTDLLSYFKRLGFDRSNFINLHKRV